MEDSFRVRVDKTFGALGGNTTSSIGVSSSLWTLTDEEIERREWIRNNKEESDGGESGPSDRRIQLDSDPKDSSDCEDEEDELEEDEEVEEEDDAIDSESKKRPANIITSAETETSVEEYLDVRSNIGRDCTLDFEDEEDQYDKLAVGTEQADDRLYMRDVKSADYGIYENEIDELPDTLQSASKDARANHTAAKIRLKEDAEAAGNLETLQLTDNSNVVKPEEDNNLKEGEIIEGGDNPKPILKKRENLMDSKSQKRVRFIVDPTSSIEAQSDQQLLGGSDCEVPKQAPDDNSEYNSGIPDYLRNPSKYTRYTFDSSDDVDDQSNRKAFMDFFYNRSRETNTGQSSLDGITTCVEIPKSIVFTPRRKQKDESMEHETGKDNNLKRNKIVIAAAAEDIGGESEVSAMEEDEIDDVSSSSSAAKRQGRKYRERTSVFDAEDNFN